LYELD